MYWQVVFNLQYGLCTVNRMAAACYNTIGLLPGVLEEFQQALFYSGDVLASFYHLLWS